MLGPTEGSAGIGGAICWLPGKLRMSLRAPPPPLSHMWPSPRHFLLSSNVRFREHILKPLCLGTEQGVESSSKHNVCTGTAHRLSKFTLARFHLPGDCHTEHGLCKAVFLFIFILSFHSHQAPRRQTEIFLSCIYSLFVIGRAGWARRLKRVCLACMSRSALPRNPSWTVR